MVNRLSCTKKDVETAEIVKMGKHGKKQNHHRRGKASFSHEEEDEEQQIYHLSLPPSSSKLPISDDENLSSAEEEEENEVKESNQFGDNSIPSKFSLYQQSVQSPKGDISYLQKFFLMYVGGRVPLHLQEDFCGTALLSAEWLRSDARRSAIGLDFDIDALNFCLENNVNKVGTDVDSRIFLFHGNVLNPKESKLVEFEPQNLINSVSVKDDEDDDTENENPRACTSKLMKDINLPARDIICAFNYSCCCLHSRSELLSYFKYALSGLSKNGGIFVMDLYGGTSSECELRLQRRFPNFTYIWEQAGFDIVQRKTRISLHYNLQKPQKKIRHAFSYSWRLWSLPEIKDCLEEAGFRSVHFWLRQMPDSHDIKTIQGFGSGRDIKYEELTTFQQQDSWNAYIVGVA